MPVIRLAGGVFGDLHRQLMGKPIDFSLFNTERFAPHLLQQARSTWNVRVQTEYRSIQVMNRFAQEVLGAGDPLDVYAGAVEAIADEVKHTALCVQMLEALGGTPQYPEPLVAEEPEEFLCLPMAQRATATAISMLAISETISTHLISDLQQRCTEPTVRAVLDATLADEDLHEAYGWAYVEASLQRFEGGQDYFKEVAHQTLKPLIDSYQPILGALSDVERHLDPESETEHANLGLLSERREAMVFQKALDEAVLPRLDHLGLL